MNCEPKQRKTFIRPKPKKSKQLWRSGRTILKGKDMKELREKAFQRSGGYCEGIGIDELERGGDNRCSTRIFWSTFDLHHVRHRSLTGSDELSNVLCLCKKCHNEAHGIFEGKL